MYLSTFTAIPSRTLIALYIFIYISIYFKAKMNISDDVDLEEFIARPDKISGADINAICQEVSFIQT